MLYERMEDLGLDLFCKKYSLKKRDELLSRVPKDELSCLFMGFDDEDILGCFSPNALRGNFSRLPVEDTFLLLSYIKVKTIPYFFTMRDIPYLISIMPINRFIEDLYQNSSTLFYLLEQGILLQFDIKAKFFAPDNSISEIKNLFRTSIKYERFGEHPIVNEFKLPIDLSRIVYSFL
jgi:hypothetical protein